MVEPAEVAEGDATGLVDAVVADAIVGGWLGWLGTGLEAGVEGVQGRVAVERAMGTLLVVVGAKGVELGLEHGERRCRRLLSRNFFWVWWKRSTLPQVWGWYGVECLATMPRRSSSDSRSTLPLRVLPLKTAPLSLRKAAGKP